MIFIVVVILVLAVGLLSLVSYVKPSEAMDLNYQEVAISGKIADIIKNRKLEVVLTEQDINNIVKKQLAAHSTLPNDLMIEGAKLRLNGSQLEADVNLRWREQIPIGATVLFALDWSPPNIEVRHVGTQIKDKQLPSDWLQLAPVQIPLESYLPQLVGVKHVAFENQAIRIDLKLLR